MSEAEWISELWDKMVGITSEEKNKVKRMERAEDSLRDLWDHIKCTNIQIIGIPEEEKKKWYEKIFEEIIVENFPNMEKEIVNYNLFKIFFIPFLFLFFWDPYNLNVGGFDIIPEVSETILSSFLLYSAFQKLFPPFYLPAPLFILLLQIFCYWFLLEYF